MMTQKYIHINYFENQYTLEEAFGHSGEIGYDGIEVRDRDRSGQVALTDYLGECRRLAEVSGLKVVYGCRVDTTNPDPALRAASIADFHQVIAHSLSHGQRLANVFTGLLWEKGKTYSTSGYALATPEAWEVAVCTIREAAQRFPEMTFAMETHSGYLHDVAGPCREFLERVDRPNVLANLDYANIFLNRRGETMQETIELLSGRIGYVHLKNAGVTSEMPEGTFERGPLNEGSIDIPVQLALLKNVFNGPICVENTMKTDKLPVARQDYASLTQWLEDLK